MRIKYVPLLLLLSCFAQIFAQDTSKGPMQVMANDNTTISFFFPSAIVKVISPAVNYKFDYEKGATIGLLQARKGNSSNLTVLTEGGFIYSFIVKFSDKINNFNFILSQEDAVGKTKVTNGLPQKSIDLEEEKPLVLNNENPQETDTESFDIVSEDGLPRMNDNSTSDSIQTFTTENFDDTPGDKALGLEEGDLYDKDREEYYRIYCENNYLQRTIFKRSFRQNKRIVVKLNNILVDRDEVYLVMQLENNSKKEYNVNGLGFFLKKNELESPQILAPLYTFNLQEVIDPESINEVVCVFKKFNLSPKEEFSVVLDEKDGNRMVSLPLDNKHINAPTN